MARLGDVGKVITGNTPKTSDSQNYASNDICFVKPSDIADGTVSYLDDTEFYVSEYARAKARVLPPKSVLVTCIGIIGKVAINNVECAFNQQINAIIPNENKCLTEYLAYAIQNKQEEMQDIANAPVVPILNKTQFSDVEIKLPSLSEQKDIVEKLNAVAKLIALRKEQLAKLDQLVKSRFIELFEQYMLCKVPLQDFCVKGPQNGFYRKGAELNGSIPIIKMKQLFGNESMSEVVESDLVSLTETELSRFRLTKDDLLFGRRSLVVEGAGKCRRVGNIDHDAVFESSLLRVTLDSVKIRPRYLQEWFNTEDGANAMASIRVVTTIAGIKGSDLAKLSVPVVPIEVQDMFVTFAEQVDKSKLAIQQSLDKLETLKKSLMQEYFG